MLVSVLMSVFNDESTLDAAVESVLAQSYGNFEFVIINDASNEKASLKLDTVAKLDSRISIYTNDTNLGLTRSLNRGIGYCHGAYVARIDADDVWHIDKLLKQIQYVGQYPKCVLLGTAYDEIDRKGDFLRPSTVPIDTDDASLRKAMIKYNPFFHSSVLIKLDILKQLNGYSNDCFFAQDYNLWVRIAEKHNIANLPEVLAYRRITADNISVKKERQQRISALRSKVLAIKLLDDKFLNYRYLLNDMAVIVLPTILISLIRSIKGKNA